MGHGPYYLVYLSMNLSMNLSVYLSMNLSVYINELINEFKLKSCINGVFQVILFIKKVSKDQLLGDEQHIISGHWKTKRRYSGDKRDDLAGGWQRWLQVVCWHGGGYRREGWQGVATSGRGWPGPQVVGLAVQSVQINYPSLRGAGWWW